MIKFGTSGWRGIIGDEFTFLNARKVAHAISGHIKESLEYGINSNDYRVFLGDGARSPVPTVTVGFVTRLLSAEFAHEIAAVFALDGVKSLIADSDLPTPAVAWSIISRKA